MKNPFSALLCFCIILFATSCEPDNSEEDEPEAEDIIEIPDEHFKAALINTNSIDTNGDGVGDRDIDLNDDGKIQRREGELIEGLIIYFDYNEIGRYVDLSGIENFVNLKNIKMKGNQLVSENTDGELIIYDFSKLENLQSLELNNLGSQFFKELNFFGLSNLNELKLINNRPYYNGVPFEFYKLPINFIDINMEGLESLTSLDITNSFLKIDFCQAPSLTKLSMFYLEGGEPDVFDFHCLTNLEWLNIGENHIKTLILKNSSVVNTLLSVDIGSAPGAYYPFVEYICIDNIPEEFEQIASLRNEDTEVVTDCEF